MLARPGKFTMVELPENSKKEQVSNSQDVDKPLEDFLLPNADEVIAQRQAKLVEEKQRDEEKASREAKLNDYRSKYNDWVLQTKERLAQEDAYCNSVFNSAIVPYLKKIQFFAEEKSIYPTPEEANLGQFFEKLPNVLPQIFTDPSRHDYYVSKDFKVSYYWRDEEDLKRQFEKQSEELSSLHSYIDCGLEWGYKMSKEEYTGEDGWGNSHYRTDYFIVTFGISMRIDHTGEVTLNDLLFSRSELSENRFKQALSNSFFAPKQIHKSNISRHEYFEGRENDNEDEEEKSLRTRSKERFFQIVRIIKSNWKKLWSAPEDDTKPEDSLIRKLWYGFPPKEETNNGNNDWSDY